MKNHIFNPIRKVAVTAMAISLVAAVAGNDGNLAAKLNDEGVALVQKGDVKAAIGKFRAAIDADVHHVEAAHNLGKLLISAKQYVLAERILTYVTRENQDDMGAYVQIAQATALSGNVKGCKEAIERIAKSDKSLLPSLALLLSGQNTQSMAEYAIARYVEIDPQNAEAWYNMGIIAQRAKKFTDAEMAYGKATGLNPAYSDAWVNLGNIQDAQGKTDAAIASYEKAYAANKDSSLALYNLGRMLVLKGKNPTRGLDLLQKATRHGSEPGANAARELLIYLVAQTKKGGAK